MLSNIDKYKEIEDKRVVLLQSGGLDSNVCAAILSKLGFEIHHLFVNYGQNTYEKEYKMVSSIISHYGGVLHEASVNADWLSHNAIVSGEVKDWESEGEFNTVSSGVYVPLRNAFLLCLAGSLAEDLSIPYICSALDGAEDFDGHPLSGTTDKHPTFVKKIEQAITEGSSLHHIYGNRFTVLAPVMGMFKKDIVSLGSYYDADFSLSWSCYNSYDKPCGECSACRERAKGFYYAGIEDPLLKKFGVNIPLNKIFE